MDGLCIVGHKKCKIRNWKEHSTSLSMEEVHDGGEGPRWAVVPMKKKKTPY